MDQNISLTSDHDNLIAFRIMMPMNRDNLIFCTNQHLSSIVYPQNSRMDGAGVIPILSLSRVNLRVDTLFQALL
jgi:hypothetical protein